MAISLGYTLFSDKPTFPFVALPRSPAGTGSSRIRWTEPPKPRKVDEHPQGTGTGKIHDEKNKSYDKISWENVIFHILTYQKYQKKGVKTMENQSSDCQTMICALGIFPHPAKKFRPVAGGLPFLGSFRYEYWLT